jgi:pimeloyl-ACP methyl ester carboxylesterase
VDGDPYRVGWRSTIVLSWLRPPDTRVQVRPGSPSSRTATAPIRCARPRELAEHFFDIARWTEMPRGGHFAALEAPELLADEIREFFRPRR